MPDNSIERIWEKNSKIINITKYSKSWWNMNCSRNLVVGILRSIGHPSISRIGSSPRKWSSILNIPFLTSRFRKSPIKNRVHKNS